MFRAEVGYDRWVAVVHRRAPDRALAAAFERLAEQIRSTP